MEIVADLFGWGMVGLTVAAPLVSLLTDLEARAGRGPNPSSPSRKPATWHAKPAPGCIRARIGPSGATGGPTHADTLPGAADGVSRGRLRVDTGGSEDSVCSCLSADSHGSAGSGGHDAVHALGCSPVLPSVTGAGQASGQAAGDSPHSETGDGALPPSVAHPPRHSQAPTGARRPRHAPSAPVRGAPAGLGTRWGHIITPPPVRMHPRQRQSAPHGSAFSWGPEASACSKAWNSSSHRAFSAHGALVSSYTMSECQGPHPYWEARHVVFHQPGRIVFGVFDGHGRNGQGKLASEFCSEFVQTHLLGLARQCRRQEATGTVGTAPGGTDQPFGAQTVASTSSPKVAEVDGLGGSAACRSDNMRSAFLRADEAFREKHPDVAYDSGTTALVVAVGRASLCIANAGDCRAVMSRCGRAVDLSTDHKPSLPAEFARIQAAGGRIVRPDPRGPLRVCSPDGRTGLAVSRGLGDHAFKDPRTCPRPLLEPTPDVREVALSRGDDELLILASDGLWDVISSQQAVDMARAAPAQLASDLLVREAIACGSQDNVTVVVIRL